MFFTLKKFFNFTYFPKLISVIIRQLIIPWGFEIVCDNGNLVYFIIWPQLIFWNVFTRSWTYRYQIFFIIQTKQLSRFILIFNDILRIRIRIRIAFLNYIIFWKFAKSIWESVLFEMSSWTKFCTFFLVLFFKTIYFRNFFTFLPLIKKFKHFRSLSFIFLIPWAINFSLTWFIKPGFFGYLRVNFQSWICHFINVFCTNVMLRVCCSILKFVRFVRFINST